MKVLLLVFAILNGEPHLYAAEMPSMEACRASLSDAAAAVRKTTGAETVHAMCTEDLKLKPKSLTA